MDTSHRRDVTETSGPSAEERARHICEACFTKCPSDIADSNLACYSCVSAALDQVRRDTVQEAARALCFWCKEGNPLGKDERHHFGRGCALQSCGALALYRRWPAYAPGEKP